MFENYGDVNFFDGGRLVEKTEDAVCFNVLVCDYVYDCTDTERCFKFDHCYIDISDSWIDAKEVESFCGKTDDDALFASDVISYYGTQNSYMGEELTKAEVVNYMKNFKNEMPEKFYCENFTNIEEE